MNRKCSDHDTNAPPVINYFKHCSRVHTIDIIVAANVDFGISKFSNSARHGSVNIDFISSSVDGISVIINLVRVHSGNSDSCDTITLSIQDTVIVIITN